MLCSKWICNKLDNSFPASCKGDISSLQLFAINILPQWIQFYYLQHDFQTWDWLRLLVLKMHVLIIKWILPKKMSIWLYCAWRLVFFIRNVTSNQPNFANSMTLTHKWVHLQDILSCFKMHMPQRHIWKKEDIKPPIIFNLDSRWRWVVNVPAALPHYPLNRRHSQPHGTTGCFGEETNLFPLPRIEWIIQPQEQSLCWVSYQNVTHQGVELRLTAHNHFLYTYITSKIIRLRWITAAIQNMITYFPVASCIGLQAAIDSSNKSCSLSPFPQCCCSICSYILRFSSTTPFLTCWCQPELSLSFLVSCPESYNVTYRNAQ
jgi:hypothetical protein